MHSPNVDGRGFQRFVEKCARKYAANDPEWAKWTKDTNKRLWEEMVTLKQEDKCRVTAETGGNKLYLPNFYADLLEAAYEIPDQSSDQPFLSEITLKLTIPPENIRHINVTSDLVSLLDHPQTAPLPIIRLLFPSPLPSALAVAHMIPRRIVEAAMLKVRHYLRVHDNKEFLQNKLIPSYKGEENLLKDLFMRIMIRPLECLDNLEAGEDFSYMFWSRFCGVARTTISEKFEMVDEEIAALQSLCIIEILNTYYRAQSFRQKERDLAFADLEIAFEQKPYAYSMEDLVKIRNSKGVPLLGLYSEEELRDWLTEKIRSGTKDVLPAIFSITVPGDTRRYVKKGMYLKICLQVLVEARPPIKKALWKHWTELIKEYRTEPAMNNEEEFDRLLRRLGSEAAPDLITVINDEKLFLVCEEMERTMGFLPEDSQFFLHGGKRVSLADLLLLKRKETLANIRVMLPVWYSIPLFIAIAGFFRVLKTARLNRKLKGGAGKQAPEGGPPEGAAPEGDQEQDIRAAGRKLESELLPAGEDINVRLKELENRWSTLVGASVRQVLVTDVNTLIRDRLRQVLRGQRHMVLTRDALEKIAHRIAEENSALRTLKDQNGLRQYIVLYMVNLLVRSKF